MLKHISFENYRAFQSAGYPIRPVTIFLGANSVGKTSALQLPLLLKQTAAVSGQGYSSALKIHGREVSFGDSSNIFHKQQREKPLKYSFSITDSNFYQFLTRDLVGDFQEALSGIARYALYQFQKKNASFTNFDEKLLLSVFRRLEMPAKNFFDDIGGLIEDFITLKDHLLKFADAELNSVPIYSSRYLSGNSSRGRTASTINLKTLSKSDLLRCVSMLEGLAKLSSRNFTISVEIKASASKSTNQLDISGLELRSTNPRNNQQIISINTSINGEIRLQSDFMNFSDINSYNKTLEEIVVSGSDIFSFIGPQLHNNKFMFPELVRKVLARTIDTLHSLFAGDGVRHIGPLRAHPKRFYFLDTAQPGSAEGDSLIEALRENHKLKRQVNEWLHRFGVDLNVSQFQEIIHRLSIKSDSNSFELDITDVGFGISQILPILVEGYLSPDNTMIVVEQPEIHLHPKMQGDLADLFISMSGAQLPGKSNSTTPKKYFLIETHSEYLLSRLRRRIAEGAVSHEDVAVVIAERDANGATTLDNVGISESGNFRWPQGFQEASLDDTLAFAEAMAKQHSLRQAR